MDIATPDNLKVYFQSGHGLLQRKENTTFITPFPGPTTSTVLHAERMTSLE